MANVLKQNGYNVRTSDIIDRTNGNVEVIDFLNYDKQWDGDIITEALRGYMDAKEKIYTANRLSAFVRGWAGSINEMQYYSPERKGTSTYNWTLTNPYDD